MQGLAKSVILFQNGEANLVTRNADGTITVQQLKSTWVPNCTRNPDGTVTVN